MGDRFVQPGELDQEVAWQKAFTLEVIFAGAVFGLVPVLLPGSGSIYGEVELVAPGLVLAATFAIAVARGARLGLLPADGVLQAAAHLAVDAVVGFVTTVGLAIAGVGYWSLVIGQLAGVVCGGHRGISLLALQVPPAVRRGHHPAVRELLLAPAGGHRQPLVIAQASFIAGEAVAGLAGTGALALAVTIAHYADRVDGVVTATLYPAICAVKDRRDLLFESFVKSNRLTLMWGIPFGVGLSLFAADLVEFVLGSEWNQAVLLLQVFALTAAAGHIGFNWDAFYRARGDTRPIAIWSFVTMLSFLAVPLPLLIFDGLDAFAYGMGVMTLVSFSIKGYFLARLFDGFQMLRHAARALAPTVPAVAAVALVRALDGTVCWRSPWASLASI